MQTKTIKPIQNTAGEFCAYLKASDGLPLRYGLWRSACPAFQGTILFLTGRSEFIEKYSETIERLNQKGFDVFSFDWRGQGLSGRMLKDTNRGYVHSYNQYLADLDLLLRRIVIPQMRGSLYFLAHSMGAHIALRYLASRSRVPVCKAMLTSPMIDIVTGSVPAWIVRYFSRMIAKTGCNAAIVLGSGRFHPYKMAFEGNRLTSDPQRFKRVQQMVHRNPGLSSAGVTYGWLAATFDSIGYLRKSVDEGRIADPIMVLLAEEDHVVSNRAARVLLQKLPDCRLEIVSGARHEILQEQEHVQAFFWAAVDRFF